MTPSEGIRISGAVRLDQVGTSVSSAGDINHDGIDDIVIGALGASASGKSSPTPGEGVAYVIFGKTDIADIDLGALSPTDGFRIIGGDTDDWTGWTVSSAGDVNGDGVDDVLVSANRASGVGNLEHWAGEAYVIFGKETSDGIVFSDIDVDQLSPEEGIRIIGADAEDRTGSSVAAVGDVNGDGYADILVSARRGDGIDGASPDSGEIYLIFGGANLGTIDLGDFTAADGIIFYGADPGDMAGYSIAGGGDVNGDGVDDIIIGTGFCDEAYVIFG